MLVLAFATVLTTGCASNKYEEGERLAHQPINCRTAEGDIRALRSEKAHVEEMAAAGAASVVPAAAVLGIITGHEGENLKVACGEYNRMIDKRIAQIKEECGVD
jgi:hypothetical protein